MRRRRSTGRPRIVAASAAALVISACSTTSVPTRSASPSRGETTPTAAAPTSPAPRAACTNASVINSWPLARRAAALVVVPVLDFTVAGVTPVLRAGAGGLLFLGSAAAPADLASRLRLWSKPFRPLVMADEEGGEVSRLDPVVASVPWPQEMARTMTPAQVQSLASRVARQMRSAGVTVDLAPVLDVDARPGPSASNPDGKRAFSGNAAVVSTYGIAFLRGLRAGGVVPVVKHFPGLGGSSGNTDVGSARTVPFSSLQREGLVPFRASIGAGAPAVMVANASVPGLTSLPASLSRAVITTLLREQLGFHGLVVTDSLSAGAVQRIAPLPTAAVDSVVAGADMVLFGSTLTAAERALLSPTRVRRTFTSIVDALVAAVRSHRLTTARLDAAAGAVMNAAHAQLCP